MRYPFIAIVSLLVVVSSRAEDFPWPPKPYSADYALSINGQDVGTARRSLSQLDSGHWLYQTSARAGIIAQANESSEFIIQGEQLRPISYHLQRQMLFSQRHTDLDFRWNDQQLVTHTERDAERSFPLPAASLDKLSLEIQMRHDLQTHAAKLSYALADADGIKLYDYQITAHERLHTAMGDLDTLKIERPNAAQDQRQTIFWVAPSLADLPVQVEQVEHGTVFLLRLTAYHPGSGGANDAPQALGKVTPR